MGHISLAILLVTSYLALTLGQGLNVLIVCDEGNRQAENGVETAIKYLAQNNMANINKKSMVTLTGQPFKAAGDICTELDSMIDSESPPDVVLDLSTAGESSEVVKSLTRTLGLPTVSSSFGKAGDIKEWSALTAEQQKYLVQVRSPSDMLQYIIEDLVKHTQITDVAIIIDESFKNTKHYKQLLLNMPVRHSLTMMEMEMYSEELGDQLDRLVKETKVTNFLILASPENAKKALSEASLKNIAGDRYSWFVGTMNSDYEFDATCCQDMKVVTFQPMKPSSNQLMIMRGSGLYQEPLFQSAFYADLAAKTLAAVAKLKKDGGWPEMTYTKCSQFAGGQPIERSLDLMSALKMSGVQDVWGNFHLSTNGESHMEFTLKVHLHQALDSSLADSHDVGTWTAGIPSSFNFKSADMEDKLVVRKARDVLKIVSVIQPPFMQWNDAKGTYEGYAYDMMEEIKKILDIEYELYIAPDDTYGIADAETNNWNGLIGELHNRKADIGLGAISVAADKEIVVDFTVPFYNPVGVSILMKKTKVKTSLFKFFTVLENIVWGCIIGAYFLTSLLLWCFDRFSPFSYQNNMEKFEDDDETRYFNMKESFWFCMTSLTPQGGGEAPKSMSGRMVAATWWLFGFIIVASYTANLAAFLTVSRLAVDLQTFDDLIDSSQMTYATINGSEAHYIFENLAYVESVYYENWKDMSLDDKITEKERSMLAVWAYPVSDKYTRIWQAMTLTYEIMPSSWDEALEKVLASSQDDTGENFALLAEGSEVRYQALINCDLRRVGEDLFPKPYALALQKGSPLKQRLNDAILRLSNERKLEGLKEKWWNQNENRKICEEEDTGAIGIEDMGGIFIVIGLGLILALLSLAGEFYYYKIRASRPSDKVGKSDIKKVAEIE